MGHTAEAASRALFGITHGQAPRRGGMINARYDLADTNDGNQRHWQDADALSAKSANSPSIRRVLRMRARLERDNGGNCKGAIETIGHDLVGTGPRLDLTIPAPDGSTPDTDLAEAVERRFMAWAEVVDFADKLRIKVESEVCDGESFTQFVTDDDQDDEVKLDLKVYECDQIESPWGFNLTDPLQVSGIVFKKNGKPSAYHVLKYHPGDMFAGFSQDYTQVPAESIIHWFRPRRAGEARGIPRITPGLPLLAQLRGYARSVLGAARIAAMFAAVMKTNLPPIDGPEDVTTYEKIPLDHDGMFTLPAGWDIQQLEARQPSTNYAQFTDYHLTQFGRGVHLPRNMVTGDSSGYNFSSARLDHLMYRGAIRVERRRLKRVCLDRIFRHWLAEAVLIPGYLPPNLPPVETWAWAWQYDGTPSINPVDDATAAEIELRNGLTDHATELAERGVDWRVRFKSLAQQRQLARQLDVEDMLWPAKRTGGPVGTDQSGQAQPPQRTNEGTTGKPQTEADTVLETEARYA